jgi:GH24 family phage-related lysozyme (muramidase)
MTPEGRKLICSWEGLVLSIYLDNYGNPTGGWGHKLTKSEQGQHPLRSPVSRELADQWLDRDSEWVDAAIDAHVHVGLNQNQRAALECLVYNTGAGVLEGKAPHLMAALAREDWQGAANEFLDICHATDQHGISHRDEGLARRRRAEAALFLRPVELDPVDSAAVLAAVGVSLDEIRLERSADWYAHGHTFEVS